MLTLEQCWKIEPSLRELPDEEVKAILDDMCDLGQLAYEQWSEKKAVPKIPLGSLEPPSNGAKVKL